jgi:hypothetical protein
MEEVTLGAENNKATGFDSIPAEAWKMVTKDKRPEILMKLFNMVINKENFQDYGILINMISI